MVWNRGSRPVVWDADTGQTRELTSTAKTFTVIAFALTPDGKRLVAGHGKSGPPLAPSAISLWDLETGKELHTWEAHQSSVTAVGISADGSTITSIGLDGYVKTWNAAGRLIETVSHWRNHIDASALTPNGQTAALSAGSVQIVEVSTWRERKIAMGRLGSSGFGAFIALTPDGRAWASSIHDREVRLWENLAMEAATLRGHTGTVYGVAFSPDGTLLATCSGDAEKPWNQGEVKLWDVATAKELTTLGQQIGGFCTVKFSPDGKTIAAGSALGLIEQWDVQSGKHKGTLSGHFLWVRCISFSPDSAILASGGYDQLIRLWNLKRAEEPVILKGNTGQVTSLAFSSDGKLLVSGSADRNEKRSVPGEVKLWDVAAGKELFDFQKLTDQGHSDRVFGVAFSPDNKTVASVAFDQKAILWDVAARQPRGVLGDNSRWAKAAAFTSDGRVLAVGSAAPQDDGKWVGTVKFWDPVIGKHRASFVAHAGFVAALDFDREHRWLATGGTDGVAKLWSAAPSKIP